MSKAEHLLLKMLTSSAQPTPYFRAFDLQNYTTINLCCFIQLYLWHRYLIKVSCIWFKNIWSMRTLYLVFISVVSHVDLFPCVLGIFAVSFSLDHNLRNPKGLSWWSFTQEKILICLWQKSRVVSLWNHINVLWIS